MITFSLLNSSSNEIKLPDINLWPTFLTHCCGLENGVTLGKDKGYGTLH